MAGRLILKTYEDLNLKKLKRGQVHRIAIEVQRNPLGVNWRIPIVVAVGNEDGPTLGITAAVHGNELNGLPTIFKLFNNVKVEKLKGILIAVPVVNVPGYLLKQREFGDGKDLNRLMPGKERGTASEMFNYNITSRIISRFDYLLDLHTASFGRINSLYVRADLDNEMCRKMAYLQNPQIIVNKYDEEGTLRAWANSHNIPTITIEIGNPHTFQHHLIDHTYEGILNLMRHLKMVPGRVKSVEDSIQVCDKSSWIYAYTGGVVDVTPGLTDFVKKGQKIGTVCDIWGQVLDEILCPEDGYVIGKNINPVCEAGTRILHLGVKKNQKTGATGDK